MRRTIQCAACVVMLVAASATARADAVTDWNAVLFRAAVIAGSSPLNMTRFATLVEAAVFDAVNGIDRLYTPIHVAPAAPADASRSAAAVQAAYSMLARIYPQNGLYTPIQSMFDARLAASLAEIAMNDSAASMLSGRAWGETVADAIWTWRLTDGFATFVSFPNGLAPGLWRQTPNDPYVGTSAPGVGYRQFSEMTPWAIESPSQFRPAGPPALTSDQYTKDFNETKTMGSLTSASRTADQTNAAWFWALSTAPFLWNRAAVSLITGRHDGGGGSDSDQGDEAAPSSRSLIENARLLASLNVAMADAAIGCWDAKYIYDFWRPITAIRDVSDDGNPATTSDATWTPLFATPGHPEYPSGHSCVSGAAVAVLANEFGDATHFKMTNDVMVGVTRSFQSFSEALEEVKNARIFAGIHFRTACDDGTAIGIGVAEYTLAHDFQRVQ